MLSPGQTEDYPSIIDLTQLYMVLSSAKLQMPLFSTNHNMAFKKILKNYSPGLRPWQSFWATHEIALIMSKTSINISGAISLFTLNISCASICK